MEGYTVTKEAENVYNIRNDAQCNFFVVEGKDRAAVIDTGVPTGVMDRTDVDSAVGIRIMPIIRSLTQKPLILVITHLHVDHMYHMDEFDEIYMSHKELTLPEEIRRFMSPGKELDYSGVNDIHTGDVLDLGGSHLEICELAGHSPGSVIVWNRENNLLFTGDAIGNGTGVFMQVMTSESLSVYYESLRTALKWLMDRGGRMRFLGGHVEHQANSLVLPGWNPLGIGMMADMIELVDRVVRGEIQGNPYCRHTKIPPMPEDVLYAAYGRAELLYKKESIHRALY